MIRKSSKTDWSHGVGETKIENFEELYEIIKGKVLENAENYIFRGHRKNDWKLRPKLLRNQQENLDASNILNSFKRSLRGLRGTNPPELDDLEMWALGRHFGLNTPLLDWTKSPYVALFFAFAEADTDDATDTRVVYSLNRKRINDLNSIPSSQIIEFYEPMTDENSRLINQSGLFTFTSTNNDIESLIRSRASRFSTYDNLILLFKVHIKNESRTKILKHLNWMNINYLTLFPDISGAAKHANLQNEIEGY